MTVFNLPDLGEGLEDARVVEWHVSEGDRIVKGQPMVSMETAKAIVDIPCPVSGIVGSVKVAVDDLVDVGAPLIEFTDKDNAPSTAENKASYGIVGDIPSDAAPNSEFNLESLNANGQNAANTSSRQTKPDSVIATGAGNQHAETTPLTHTQSQLQAAPIVRHYAHQHGVDLSQVTATGFNDSITRADVDAYLQQASTHQSVPHTGSSKSRSNSARRRMASAMAKSHSEVVPATVTDFADVNNWNRQTDATVEILLAIESACREEPKLNASYNGSTQSLESNSSVNIGIAVDLPEGLFVPVIKNVENKSATDLRSELDTRVSELKVGQVSAENMQNPTITLSNFGSLGGIHAQLVVLPPQIAILGTGRITPMVVARDCGVHIRRQLPVSLTFDHRAVTGGEVVRFLNTFIKTIESYDIERAPS